MLPYDDPSKPTWHEIVREGIRAANEVHEELKHPELAEARKQRSSLIKLAHRSLELHIAALAKGMRCWRDGKGPLCVAVTALGTAVRNQKQENAR
jgi:hypothetical protein